MNIDIKDFYARDNRMPGVGAPNDFTVSGIVTCGNSNFKTTLVHSAQPSPGTTLNLDLMVEFGEIGMHVITDEEVRYTQPSGADINNVNIFYNGEVLISLDVEIVH